MSLRNKSSKLLKIAGLMARASDVSPLLREMPATQRGVGFAENWSPRSLAIGDKNPTPLSGAGCDNPLRAYFESHKEGRGIWKWEHYFDVYHRHLSKFVGREVHILEIGVFSGGSLGMWRNYFGSQCFIYGVDIEKDCMAYEGEATRIFIGDQANRQFWQDFKKQVPRIDVLIDDGGHESEQQIVTLEEMLPHLQPDGVYLCEDVHGRYTEFTAYIHGLATSLNENRQMAYSSERHLSCQPTPFQQEISSIHLYPFINVIEKTLVPLERLAAPRHGTEWQPFL